jgi:methionyl-tRNA synthetase
MTSKSNYKERRKRGQCATCENPSIGFRCDSCKEEYNAYNRENRRVNREARERRLAVIDARLSKEVAELECRK